MQRVKENFAPGITVAFVSIPLSTALAIASGSTPMMGISTAIYGPGVSGLIGGSDFNILGPAGALVNVLNQLSSENGVQIIPLVAIGSGIITLCAYKLKLEHYCMLVPFSVLEGFSFGIGITIGAGQLNNAFGLVGLKKHPEFA